MLWLTLFMQAVSALPVIVAGIEQIHADANGATKKQLALEALGLATSVATGVLPPEQARMAQIASQGVGSVIDGIVAGFNASGFFKKSQAAVQTVNVAAGTVVAVVAAERAPAPVL